MLTKQLFDWKNPQYKIKPLIRHNGTCVVAEGELTLIAGPKKSLKSHVAYSIALAGLGAPANNCIGFTSQKSNPSNPYRVICIDTEQPRSRFSSNIKNMYNQGVDPEVFDNHFFPFHWKGATPLDMRNTLPLVIEEYRTNIVIIDGIADFVDDINSISESREVVELLMKCSEVYQCAIIAIIHFNPSSKKERGHLGTILSNKTDGYISLTRTAGGGVLVAADDGCRGEPFKPFTINYDSVTNWIYKSDTKTLSPVSTEELVRSIPRILQASPTGELERSEIVHILAAEFRIDTTNVTTIDRAIKSAKERGLITQAKPRAPYRL